MKRMYGEERHISVLRSEIESNDVEYHTDKWSQQANLKRYKPKKEEIVKTTGSRTPVNHSNVSTIPASSTTVTTTSATTTTTAATSSTTGSTLTGNRSTTFEATTTTTSWADVTSVDTTVPVTTTTEFDYTSTTTEPDSMDMTTLPDSQPSSTTLKAEARPQIFQDTLEKSSTTTEKANLFYKSKGVNACPVKEEVVAPFWANSTRGEVLALLNLYPFEQYVHWERCTFENKQMFCREGCRCEQQYRLHRLLAYDPTNDCRGIFSDWFKFPSCCVCRCYDLPNEFRLTSRSPRKEKAFNESHN
ncbi:spaetzle domain-containing protein 4 isoform X2 [Rhodnius prolixus]